MWHGQTWREVVYSNGKGNEEGMLIDRKTEKVYDLIVFRHIHYFNYVFFVINDHMFNYRYC